MRVRAEGVEAGARGVDEGPPRNVSSRRPRRTRLTVSGPTPGPTASARSWWERRRRTGRPARVCPGR
ncbi:hypothetical protein NKH77_51205 [Streptomyces sp. M19]